MNTPICDFVRRYAESGALRMHMPGHKGVNLLGMEHMDITEIDGADSLYEANGIIRESEENASALFGCDTYYSTEGSSQCIRAMIYLAVLHARQIGRTPLIAAGRNAHKTFLSAAALLDTDVIWLYPEKGESYLSCVPSLQKIERLFDEEIKPTAVYLTSPDYLGNEIELQSIAKICHQHQALLIVDNAHGAYLKFLRESGHPIDLGADLCCDSAHKTLPVLTGGAYLHVSPSVASIFASQVKNALALFGSTSPSYLILQSLDRANVYLSEYADKLAEFIPCINRLKDALSTHGYCLLGNEPLKITIEAKKYGYYGNELAKILLQQNVVCEFCDRDYVVLMLTPENGKDTLLVLERIFTMIPPRTPIDEAAPSFSKPRRAMRIREAVFAQSEVIPANQSVGRVLAAATVGCPPAVPIVVSGEQIDEAALQCFQYYGVESCCVVAQEK